MKSPLGFLIFNFKYKIIINSTYYITYYFLKLYKYKIIQQQQQQQ